MRPFLIVPPLLLLASCISFPRAETMRREGKTLTPEFHPWKRNPGTQEAQPLSPEGTATPAGEVPPVKARKNFKDPYFRQS